MKLEIHHSENRLNLYKLNFTWKIILLEVEKCCAVSIFWHSFASFCFCFCFFVFFFSLSTILYTNYIYIYILILAISMQIILFLDSLNALCWNRNWTVLSQITYAEYWKGQNSAAFYCSSQNRKAFQLLWFLVLAIRESNKKIKWLKMVLFPCVKYSN